MIDYLEILRLNNLGYSQRTIETTAHCSRHTVREVLAEMDKHAIQWPVDDDISNADSNRMLFPYKYKRLTCPRHSIVSLFLPNCFAFETASCCFAKKMKRL